MGSSLGPALQAAPLRLVNEMMQLRSDEEDE
jgi:hypothetical protein